MIYSTGLRVLRQNGSDWHSFAETPFLFRESKNSVFGDWGIENGVASTTRVCLDFLETNQLSHTADMPHWLLDDKPFLERICFLQHAPHWPEIRKAIRRAFGCIAWNKEMTMSKKTFADKNLHLAMMQEFLSMCGKDFVLKGGTALMLCHGLDRFSEDLDFDSKIVIRPLMEKWGKPFFVKKHTTNAERYTVHYTEGSYLKIDCSHRGVLGNPICVHGIWTYSLDDLASQKIQAYLGRDTVRDAWDTAFLVNTCWDNLADHVQKNIKNALHYKGLDHLIALTSENTDPLLDNDQLIDNFLKALEKIQDRPCFKP